MSLATSLVTGKRQLLFGDSSFNPARGEKPSEVHLVQFRGSSADQLSRGQATERQLQLGINPFCS